MIKLIKGDITKIEVDAIVNASNRFLEVGGGIDFTINMIGGEIIAKECKEIISKIGILNPGNSVFTSSGYLPSKIVIHTVGPVWENGFSSENSKLENCYHSAIKIALEQNLKSISFPNISTGVYGFPKTRAAKIAIDTCRIYENSIDIYFVCFDDSNYQIYQEILYYGK